MNSGKRFERQWAKSAGRFDTTKVYRIPDKMFVSNNQLFSKESEADFFWFRSGKMTAMVECKAHSGRSIPFAMLRPEQEESILSYKGFAEGIVAVNLYDKDDIRNFNRCFHIPIEVWVEYREKLERKSLPIQVMEDDDRILEFPRIKGSVWDMTTAVSR